MKDPDRNLTHRSWILLLLGGLAAVQSGCIFKKDTPSPSDPLTSASAVPAALAVPVSADISPSAFAENTQSQAILLPYTDATNDLATSCTISNLSHVTVTQDCACSTGICSVKVTGALSYSGSASFSYTVTAAGGTSNTATATLTITAAATPSNLDSSWTPHYADLVSYYPLNGTLGSISNGATVPATVGSDATAVHNTHELSYITGKLIQAVSFNTDCGVDDISCWDSSISFSTGSHFPDFGVTSGSPLAFTFMLWVQTSTTQGGEILANDHITAMAVTGGVLATCFTEGCAIGNTLINDGNWHHIAIVANSSGIVGYIDGALDTGLALGPTSAGFGNDLYLGTDTANFFRGAIDEVAIFGTDLSASDVATIYTKQSAGQ